LDVDGVLVVIEVGGQFVYLVVGVLVVYG